MDSDWVQHEASQGIAKNSYVPVRIELIEIPHPYDREQAIDLMNWDGSEKHPGFQNLLARLQELMPPPVPLWKQATTLLWQQRAVIILAAIALTALFLLVKQRSLLASQSATLNHQVDALNTQAKKQEEQARKQDDIFNNAQLQNQSLASQGQTLQDQLKQQAAIISSGKAQGVALQKQLRLQSITTASVQEQSVALQEQIEQQKQILADVRRTLEPIQNLSVSAWVEVGRATPGLDRYLQFLRDSLPRNTQQGTLTIKENSGFWPQPHHGLVLTNVVKYVDLALKFKRDGTPGRTHDLLMNASSYDRDGSERGALEYGSTLQWDPNNNTLTIAFTDVPATRMWEASNSNIVSVPDLEKSSMSASFLNRRVYNLSSPEAMAAGRAQLALTRLCVNYSGRKACFRGEDMKKSTDGEGLSVYNSPVSPKGVK